MKKTKKAKAQPKAKAKKITTAKSAAVKPVETTTVSQQTTKAVATTTPFNWMFIIFGALFVTHAAFIYVASVIFPEAVVLGTNTISPLMALLYSVFVFTLIVVAAMPVIEAYQTAQRKMLSNTQWMAIYFVLNFVGLWLVARFAEQLGLGLASKYIVLALALGLDVLQGLVITTLMKKMK
jgi:hypothetical protein